MVERPPAQYSPAAGLHAVADAFDGVPSTVELEAWAEPQARPSTPSKRSPARPPPSAAVLAALRLAAPHPHPLPGRPTDDAHQRFELDPSASVPARRALTVPAAPRGRWTSGGSPPAFGLLARRADRVGASLGRDPRVAAPEQTRATPAEDSLETGRVRCRVPCRKSARWRSGSRTCGLCRPCPSGRRGRRRRAADMPTR